MDVLFKNRAYLRINNTLIVRIFAPPIILDQYMRRLRVAISLSCFLFAFSQLRQVLDHSCVHDGSSMTNKFSALVN